MCGRVQVCAPKPRRRLTPSSHRYKETLRGDAGHEGRSECGKVNAEEPPQVDHKSVTQLDSLSLSETRAPAYALAHVNEGIRWVSRHTNRTIASGRTNTDSGHAWPPKLVSVC